MNRAIRGKPGKKTPVYSKMTKNFFLRLISWSRAWEWLALMQFHSWKRSFLFFVRACIRSIVASTKKKLKRGNSKRMKRKIPISISLGGREKSFLWRWCCPIPELASHSFSVSLSLSFSLSLALSLFPVLFFPIVSVHFTFRCAFLFSQNKGVLHCAKEVSKEVYFLSSINSRRKRDISLLSPPIKKSGHDQLKKVSGSNGNHLCV